MFKRILFIGYLLNTVSLFSSTFSFSSATDNGSNVTETIDTVKLTVVSSLGSKVGVADGGGFGGTTSTAVLADSTASSAAQSMTFTFDKAVNITKLRAADSFQEATETWVFTPDKGTPVEQAVHISNGANVDFTDWNGVTSFTITPKDGTANSHFAIDDIQFTVANVNIAPTFDSNPSTSSITQSGLTLSGSLDENGTAYYVVVTNGDTAPTAANVKAGQANGGGAAIKSGNMATTGANNDFSFSITGLSNGTSYDAYVFAQDDESTPNEMNDTAVLNSKVDFTTLDIIPPVVQSIVPQGSPRADAVSVDFRVTFDENVSNVSTGDFELTKTSSANGTISSVSEVNATTKDVTVNSISGVGTLRLDLKSNTDITDASGNGNGTNGNVAAYTSGTTHTVLIPNSDASLSAANGVDESSMISLPSTANTLAQKVNLFDFNISDGGGGDTLSTNVNQIVINTSGTGPFDKVKWLLNGSDVSNIEGNYSSDKITFSDINISISDGSSEIYTLSGYFKNPTGLIDNSTFGFSVDGDTDLTLESNKTQMATTSAVTNSTNAKVDIRATRLIFKIMPSN